MQIGIDAMAFSTSRYFMRLDTLAKNRNVDYAKYCVGIGQIKMSVFPPNEDIVTIAIDAAQKVMAHLANKNDVCMLIFATESSFDLSKSAGIYVHHFLDLRPDCRVFDLKQACYSATAALQLARSFVADNPGSKVLVIGSDIVKYSAGSSGEPTQGGAAVAFIVAENPRMMVMERHFSSYTTDVMDFWRPVEEDEALFDGKLSAQNYLRSLDATLSGYLKQSHLTSAAIDYVCFHAPFGKMALKARDKSFPGKAIDDTLVYNSIIGNSCSASLYVCLISLLDNCIDDLKGRRIGLFSYGSGSVAEFFSCIVVSGHRSMLSAESNRKMLEDRIEVSFEEYEQFCKNLADPRKKYANSGGITMARIENKQRIYEKVAE
jgi:hydroxymethylglutaryl-CoA synthase